MVRLPFWLGAGFGGWYDKGGRGWRTPSKSYFGGTTNPYRFEIRLVGAPGPPGPHSCISQILTLWQHTKIAALFKYCFFFFFFFFL